MQDMPRFQMQFRQSTRTAFTLIELLVAVVVIGTLAGIAIPRYSASKELAHIAAMKVDLRNAANVEEQYAADNNGNYFSGVATSDESLNGFKPSGEITVSFTAFAGTATAPKEYFISARTPKSSQICEFRTGVISCTTDDALTTGTLHFR
ncbi:MAG TPA: prepilin-type N-terminal cleavage/methylation domain-containing protein [Gemmatimonadaceae bacterium]|nr:prepilin-type N-terminal cleavage/methylation domain-containing protein [Gemmatimonadaceae bacterium]